MAIKALIDEEKLTRLVGYPEMLPKGTVTPKGLFDEAVPEIRERAAKQLKKRRFMDAAYTILLVARLPKDTTIADKYFDCVLSRLKVEALTLVNAGCAPSAANILSPIARLPKDKVPTGCFDDLLRGVRDKVVKQLNASRLRDALDALAVLHAMPETAPASDEYFDYILLKLQTLLEESIAADNRDDAEWISSFV